ncbi:hypothetical protein SCYAM73S_01003 [Streptomyces cyaneofuscatus]
MQPVMDDVPANQRQKALARRLVDKEAPIKLSTIVCEPRTAGSDPTFIDVEICQ